MSVLASFTGSTSLTSLNKIAVLLIQARKQQGLTQKALAARFGWHEQYIQRCEATSYQYVSLERLEMIARALRIDWTIEGRLDGKDIQS